MPNINAMPSAVPSYHLQEVPTVPSAHRHGPFPKARTSTIDNDSSCGAPALGYDVLGHAGVISSVQEPGLLDDEVVINGDEEVGVLGGINDILVP